MEENKCNCHCQQKQEAKSFLDSIEKELASRKDELREAYGLTALEKSPEQTQELPALETFTVTMKAKTIKELIPKVIQFVETYKGYNAHAALPAFDEEGNNICTIFCIEKAK